ncbi:disease resistance protein RPM1 [Rosa chinensis]|uniref:disease resistance protein RPM1 n=1 Tax=Rosa chinensis TaxID=74649 RepID=UPI001AD941D2|nr:disease resistance protein RPM1 [Rosa chinensis]
MAEIAISAISLALAIFGTVEALYQKHNDGSTNVTVRRTEVWLKEIQMVLRDAEDQIEGASNQLQQSVKDVEYIAYEIEDALSEFVLNVHGNRGLSRKVHDMIPFLPRNEVKNAARNLSSKISHIMGEKKESVDKLVTMLRQISSSSRRIHTWPHQVLAEGDEIVGFKTREDELVKQLAPDDARLTILIAGPGGSGKSTVVQNVYRSDRIRRREEGSGPFGCYAWVHVLNMEVEMLLLKMLREFEAQRQEAYPETPTTVLQEEDDSKEKLALLLQRDRFLVVLDNVWSRDDLERIVSALPKGLPGSKIIITTRNSDVTSVAPDYIHDLSSGLSSEEAQELFCKKAFQASDGQLPHILEEWAQKILKRCEGMPLPISAIGNLLAKKPQTPVQWKRLHDRLRYEICRHGSDLSVISRNLQPSYRDLPSHLKSCFLYFSMFPEDYSISRERLIRLWVAEGFVGPQEGEPKEKAAGEFLDELFKRNLVVASTRDVDGRRVRRCRVLHLVREINISRQNSFLTVLERNYNPSADSIRRLSLNNGPVEKIRGMTSGIRTLLVFGHATSLSELEMILKTGKYLSVLDLQGVALKEFPEHVLGLTLLKYLSLKKTQIKTVPQSIKKLVYLETLDVRHTSVSYLPNEIWKLEMLRHLLVFCKDGGSGGVVLSASNLGALSSIQTLSLIKVETTSEIRTALEMLAGLSKLGLTDLKREDGEQLCGSIQKMQDLSKLDVRAISKDEYLDLDHMTFPLVAPLYLQRLYLEGQLERGRS